MKYIYILVALVLLGLSSSSVYATTPNNNQVCFCHNVNHNPHTICTSNQGLIQGHLRHTRNGEDTIGQCSVPSSTPTPTMTLTPTPTSTPIPSITPTITTSVTPQPSSTPTVTPTPDPKSTLTSTPAPQVHAVQTKAEAPQCNESETTKVAANFHVYRKSEDAILKWHKTEGREVNIYYFQNQFPQNIHSLRNVDNDGYQEIGFLGNLDWTFQIEQVNGCGGGKRVTVIDGDTLGWTLFR